MKYILYVILALVSFTFNNETHAQYASSPYSMFGIGEIENRTYSINGGMAGTGIGLQLRNFINTSNPASTHIDTLTFVFDISSAAKISQFSYGKKTDNSMGMNMKKLAFGFRFQPKWTISLGLQPYSNVGYKMTTETPITGAPETYTTTFEGSGGLSKLFLSNSYRFNSHLSVGVNASLLFGTVDQTETQSEFLIEKSAFTRKIYFDFGAQYTNKIATRSWYTIGAVYGYKTNISLSNDIVVSSRSTGVTLEQTAKQSTKTAIPQYFGGGASFETFMGSKAFTFALDYIFENWGALTNPSPNAKYTNSHKLSVGAQFLPNIRMPKNYFQRIIYQLGASYNLSNLMLDGQRLREYAVSVGANLPISRSMVHFSADFGYRTGKSLMTEKYVMLTLGLSFSEMWFFKRFYD
ncbi:MAG: hypothetical protein LBL90_13655 [Prevotellaceae bacterium]|nr:hypothetical protein [Prevotellaceae bacterium]